MVKLDKLLADGTDRAEAHQTFDPGFDIADPALKRRWQPPFLLVAPIIEAWLSVSGMPSSPTTAHRSTIIQMFFDLLPSMCQFCREHDLPGRIVDQG